MTPLQRSAEAFQRSLRFDKKSQETEDQPDEDGDEDGDVPENRAALASKASATAHGASSKAHESGTPEDHKKAAQKHALAFVANKMAGNKPEAKAHLDHIYKHVDCYGDGDD